MQPEVVLQDASSHRMLRRLSSVPHEAFTAEWLADVEEIASSVLSHFKQGDVIESEGAAATLREWLRRIEDRLAELASRESRQLGLHLVRRIKPTADAYGVNETTAALARTSLDLAIQKYGRSTGREFVVVEAASAEQMAWVLGPDDALLQAAEKPERVVLLPSRLTYEDAVWAYRMEALAFSFAHVGAQLRRAWKGGRLVVDGSASSVDLDEDGEHLVQQFDRRARTYNGALSGFGLVADVSDHERVREQPGWSVFVPTPNWQHLDTSKIAGLRTTIAYPSNFVVMPLTLRPWHEGASLFADEIERATGATPRDIALTLCGATQFIWTVSQGDPLRTVALWDRGYIVINDLDQYVGDLARWSPPLHKYLFGEEVSDADARAAFRRGIAALSNTEEQLSGIDIWARTGARPIFPLGGHLLFDYTLIPAVLGDLLESLSIQGGDAGRRKGDAFEEQADEAVRVGLPTVRVWPSQVLEFPDGLRREIDRGFSVGRYMFVAECKSLLVPAAHDRGDPQALLERRVQIAYAIGKAETLAAKLARYPKGTNYELPGEVVELVPCALSPFAEYMPERTPRFFLDAECEWPRVMVPREFAEALALVKDGKFTFSTPPFVRSASSPAGEGSDTTEPALPDGSET